MQKKYIFILFIYIVFVTLLIIALSKSNVYFKRKQINKEKSLEKGFGYYEEEKSLGCDSNKADRIGLETFVRKCVINQTTGNFCVNEEGEFSSKSVYNRKPCVIQAFNNYKVLGRGETKELQSENIDGTISIFYQNTKEPGLQGIVNKSTGIDYSDYFLEDDKKKLKNCIPDDFIGYEINSSGLGSTQTNGLDQGTYLCKNFINNLRSDKNYIDVYPIEKNSKGEDIKVCYDLNNVNQVETLNYYDFIPSGFALPQECYKHSNFKNYDLRLQLWPGSENPENLYTVGNFTNQTQYFSLINDDLENFTEIITQIGTSYYDIQKKYNRYIKCFLNSETTLVDNFLKSGSDYLEQDSIGEDIIYIKTETTEGDDIINISGTTNYYKKVNRSDYLESIIPSLGVCNNLNYISSDTKQYINIGHNMHNESITTGMSLFVDSGSFRSIPFSLKSNISAKSSGISELDTFEKGSLMINSNQTYSNFSKFYKVKTDVTAPDEILFTNNCIISDEDFSSDIRSPVEKNIVDKTPENSNEKFYYYGTCGSETGYFYNLLYNGNSDITLNNYSFEKGTDFGVCSNYNPSKECLDFSQYIGIASGKINYRFSEIVNTVTGIKYNYPSDIEIINRGQSYKIKEYNFGETGIKINVTDPKKGGVVNLKLLRNNSNNLFQDINPSNYIESKLKEHSDIIKNQQPTSSNLKNNSLIILPESSVVKVIDLDIFKSPYKQKEDGTKEYFCFDSQGIYRSSNETTITENETIISYLPFTKYPDKGVCSKCGELGIINPATNEFEQANQTRTLESFNLSTNCQVLEEKDYRSYKNLFEPCLENRDLVINNPENIENLVTFKNYYTEEEKNSFNYNTNQEYFTNNNYKDFFLNSENRENVNFYFNFMKTVENQIITENFINQYSVSDVNKYLGKNEKTYLNVNVSKDYGKLLNYQVSKPGIIPFRPSDICVNSFYGKYQKPDLEFNILTFSESLERDPYTGEGNWIGLKENKDEDVSYTPVRIQYGVDTLPSGNYTLKARIVDDSILDPWSDIKKGDYINPDFSFLNKLFYSMITDTDENVFNDYNMGVYTFQNDNIITPENIDTDNDIGKIDSYFVLVPSGEKKISSIYPILEVVKVIGVANNNGYIIENNINNVNETSLFPHYETGGISNDFNIINIGKKSESASVYNIIDNVYEIDEVLRDINYNIPYVSFNFEIPSITELGGLDSGIDPTQINSIPDFINSSGTFPFDKINEINTNMAPFEYYNPSLHMNYLKKSIVFPSCKIMQNQLPILNTVLFSNENNPKLNKDFMSYATEIRFKENLIYLNEYRENYTFFNKQKELSFKVGDIIQHYTKIQFPQEGIEGNTFGPIPTEYKLLNLYQIEETSVTVFDNFESKDRFMNYDYKCSVYGDEIIDEGVCAIYFNNTEVGQKNMYKELTLDSTDKIFQLKYVQSTNKDTTSSGMYIFIDNNKIKLQYVGSDGNNIIDLPNQMFFDYYKLTNWTNSKSVNRTYSNALRIGKADVLKLYRTTLTNEKEPGKTLDFQLDSILGKPYGIPFMLSSPIKLQDGISTRLNYESYSTINSYTLYNYENVLLDEVYSSDNGIKILVTDLNTQTAELEFKSSDNYKNLYKLGENNPSDINYINKNNKQYYKNFGQAQTVQGKDWKIVPKTFFPEQNYIKGVIGEYYSVDQVLLNEENNYLYKYNNSDDKIFKLENFDDNMSLVNFNNNLTSLDNNFYTFIGPEGLTDFLDYKNTLDFINLNDQNLALRIRDYTKDEKLGKFPVSSVYYNKDVTYDNSFITNLGIDKNLFEDLCLVEFDDQNLLSLGNTPFTASVGNTYDINYLEDTAGTGSGDAVCQYIFNIKAGKDNINFYNKSFCTGDTTFLKGNKPNVPNINLSNGLVFKFIPNDIDSQDYIPYKVSSINTPNIVIETGNDFPIRGSDNFLAYVNNTILTENGVSHDNINFGFTYFNLISGPLTIKKGDKYINDGEISETLETLEIIDIRYDVFKASIEGEEINLSSNTSGYKYGDYWYIEDNSKIVTFGFIEPEPGTGELSMKSFIRLKELEKDVVLSGESKLTIISEAGEFVEDASNDLTSLSDILNKDVVNYQYIPSEYRLTGITGTAFTNSEYTFTNTGTENTDNPKIKMTIQFGQDENPMPMNKAVMTGFGGVIDAENKIYVPLRSDFYNSVKCKAFCFFGNSYQAKVKYSLDKDKKILSLDNKKYSSLIFDPYKIDVFEPEYRKTVENIFIKNKVEVLNNVNDCFVLKTSDDNKFSLFCNPFLNSISNKFCSFSTEAFVVSDDKIVPDLEKLSVINSESNINLITKESEDLVYKPLNITITEILQSVNNKYSPSTSPPGVFGINNTMMQFKELRHNLKNYYVDQKYDCNIYFRRNFEETYLLDHQTFTLNVVGTNIEIPEDTLGGLKIDNNSFYIAKNINYQIIITGDDLVFGYNVKNGIIQDEFKFDEEKNISGGSIVFKENSTEDAEGNTNSRILISKYPYENFDQVRIKYGLKSDKIVRGNMILITNIKENVT